VYRGPLFEVVDRAVDFVMERLARRVEPGKAAVASDVTYEVPHGVIREAVVNAVAHRNYASKAAVQVMVFADRIEVWNPGGLPEALTVEDLRHPHHSVPRNRLICEPLYLAHYIERILKKVGRVGRGAHYVLRPKSDINQTNRTSAAKEDGSQMTQTLLRKTRHKPVKPVRRSVKCPRKGSKRSGPERPLM
jgi:predicted HTH transcriptional regulator